MIVSNRLFNRYDANTHFYWGDPLLFMLNYVGRIPHVSLIYTLPDHL